ncbi:MAG: quinone-dependent dihydroorotate dehydrogenase [Chitinophagaceae bacterium]
MYKLARNILFNFDAEEVHYFSMGIMKSFSRVGLFRKMISSRYNSSSVEDPVTVCGLRFKNRVGLAAGFDKNAKYLQELMLLGFGAIEIGTVTPLPQAGNEGQRLFRLPIDKALVNRMGFNNAGMDAIAGSLKHFRHNNKAEVIIGGNIGKNKLTPNEEAWMDYEKCFLALHQWVDYFVVNVSSPNTPGLRELQDKSSLHKILTCLQELNKNITISRPIFLKIAPDLTDSQVDEVVELALAIGLSGLVVSNTTISRDHLKTSASIIERMGQGGLSGKPLFERSTVLLNYIFKRSGGKIPLIASGGIFTAEDARAKIEAGATLVQVWTGFIYEGPGIVKKISQSLKKQHS